MKLFINTLIAIFNKLILRKSNGYTIKIFCKHMGLAYIKLAQILAMQNIDGLFTEKDRQDILDICDNCNPISYKEIICIVKEEYNNIEGGYKHIFKKIYKKQLGSASISQVHKAVLYNGDKVVIKVKRKDITNKLDKDIAFITSAIKIFGRFFNFYNYLGSTKALNFYQQWLKEETDFNNEVENIKTYTNFAKSVNKQIKDCVDIVIPKVYEEYCTSNIIVMEYIPYQTINKSVDEDKLLHGLSSYIKLSFYALLNGKQVIWHGDPHAANIYIDKFGNIGFLDMGLIFKLSEEDTKNVKKLFFNAYFGKVNNLYNMLIPYFKGNALEKEEFKQDIKIYCQQLKERPLTSFFIDMMLVCFKYNISPPDYLYGMAKAFVYLGGIDTIYQNKLAGHELLKEQINEYISKQSKETMKRILNDIVTRDYIDILDSIQTIKSYII